MNKKAVTTGGIVVIILGFLVILLIVTGPLKVGYDYAQEKFFGEHSIFSSLAPSREKEFQPYTGANVQMSSEEVIVDNSVKAFICAVNSLALGKEGWTGTSICPEGFKVSQPTCSGAAYGQSCVECYGGALAFQCNVKDFELPQEIGSNVPLVKFAEEWMARYNDPKYLVYYESFPRGEEASWQINKGSFFWDVVLFGAVLNVVPSAGKLGKAGWARSAQIFSNLIKKNSKSAIKETTPEMLEALYKRLGYEWSGEMGAAGIRETLKGFNKEGYELLLRSERLYVELTESLSSRISGLYTESIGKSGAELSEEIAEKVRAAVLKRYGTYGKLADDEVAGIISRDILKEIDEYAPNILKQEDKNIITNSISKFIKNPLRADELASLEKQQVIKQFIAKNLLTETGELSEEAMQKLFANAFSKEFLETVDVEIAESIAERAAGHAEGIIDLSKEGSGMWKLSVLSSMAVRQDFEKMTSEVMALNAERIERLLLGVSPAEMAEVAAAKGGWTKAAFSRYNPFYITFKGKDFLIPHAVILKSLTTAGGTVFYQAPKAGLTAAQDVWRSRVARYSIAYIVSLAIAQADANNEKYKDHGGDAIVVQKPYLYDKNKVYSLSKDTSDYFLNLFKFDGGKKGYSRFFMASPCKTDLLLSKTTCSCLVKNNAYIMKSTQQPIDSGSVTLDKASSVPVYMFDSVKDRAGIVSYCTDRSTEFGKLCNLNVAKNPEAADKFVHYMYDEVYVGAINFVNELRDSDAESYSELTRTIISQGDISSGIGVFTANHLAEFTRDLDFGALCMFGSGGPIGPCVKDLPQHFEDLLASQDNPLILRESPVSFDEFKVDFEKIVSEYWLNDPVFDMYTKLINIYNYNPAWVTDYPLADRTFLSIAANNSYWHYNQVLDDKVDKSKVMKECSVVDVGKNSRDIFVQDFIYGRVSVPCFNAQAILKPGYNYGHNYCFTGDTKYIENAKWIFNGLAIAIDVGVGVMSIGVAEVPITAATGFFAAWAGHEMDKKQWWPNH